MDWGAEHFAPPELMISKVGRFYKHSAPLELGEEWQRLIHHHTALSRLHAVEKVPPIGD